MNEKQTQLNLIQIALKFINLENFVGALHLVHVAEFLKSGGHFTVFAPVNLAFLQLPERALGMKGLRNNLLSTIIQHHIVPGKYYANELVEQKELMTLIGQVIYPMRGKGDVWINDVKLLHGDHEASNGILHVVDGLIMPEMKDFESDFSHHKKTTQTSFLRFKEVEHEIQSNK